jgi:hypothetical protein
MAHFQKHIFIKLTISFFQAKETQSPTPVQVFGVFSCTLASRIQKKIFRYDCDISVTNLPEKTS